MTEEAAKGKEEMLRATLKRYNELYRDYKYAMHNHDESKAREASHGLRELTHELHRIRNMDLERFSRKEHGLERRLRRFDVDIGGMGFFKRLFYSVIIAAAIYFSRNYLEPNIFLMVAGIGVLIVLYLLFKKH